MMMLEKEFNWNDALTWTKRGIIVKREKRFEPVINRQSGEEVMTERSKIIIDWEIPMFNKDQDYLRDLFEVEKENE